MENKLQRKNSNINKMMLIDALINPEVINGRNSILANPCTIPQESGIYAWYFHDIPSIVPLERCITKKSMNLLYIGISPDKKSKPNSKQNIRIRIKNHYQGNAAGSTLRRSLGVLLTEKSNFPLRKVGSGKKMTFTNLGEQWLDKWMEKNAFVCWITHPAPWELEEELLGKLSLPLNIKGNRDHPFATELNRLRKDSMKKARELPVFIEDKLIKRKRNFRK
jgi:hypothetical protein